MAADRRTLQRNPGVLSGRIKTTSAPAPEGEYVFCLGVEQPGWTGKFGHNTRVQVQSDLYAFVDKTITIARVRVRGPRADYVMPSGWTWSARCTNDGSNDRWVHSIQPGDDFSIDVAAIQNLVENPGGTQGLRFELRALNSLATDPVELEIPSVIVDSIVETTIPGGIGVYNVFPVNGMTNVSRSQAIRFTGIVNTGTTPSNASIQAVYVNGVAAVLAGVAQPGWLNNPTTRGTGAREWVITPPVPFGSEELVTVRVMLNIAGTTPVDTTWSFTTVDETAPQLTLASAPAHDRVRVRFNEPMQMSDSTDVGDVLYLANWTVTPLTAPAVTVNVIGAEVVSEFEVDLVLDIPMTQGATYEVVVVNVEDLPGNPIAAPFNRFSFIGYECPVPEGRRFELWRMVADMDRRRDETRDLYKFLSVLQEPTNLLLCDIDRWVDILDVDFAEERYVDHMLITLGNPFEFDLDLVDKRRLVRSLIRVYQQKGTAIGIINVIRFFLGLEVTIEAYNNDGWILGESELGLDTYLLSSEAFAKYSFVVVSPVTLTDEQRSRIDELVEYMKPAHTHHIMTVEPTPPGEELTEFWDVGVSQLGLDTILDQI